MILSDTNQERDEAMRETGVTKYLTDLERCMYEGISLTELRRRREEQAKRIADPAAAAFRKAFAEYWAEVARRKTVTKPRQVLGNIGL
jgi:hypothetical protein